VHWPDNVSELSWLLLGVLGAGGLFRIAEGLRKIADVLSKMKDEKK